ncbi:MAG: hypothetical protein ABH810_02050 [bacterium]
MYEDEQNRVISSVKESVEEAGQKSEFSAYFFIIGVSLAIFAGLVLGMANLKSKQNELETYKQKIQNDVNVPLSKYSGSSSQVKYLSSQISFLKIALSKKIDFASLLNELVKNQYQRAKWTNFSLSSSEVTIEMKADNFDEMNQSIKALGLAKGVKQAQLSEVSVNPDDGSVSYTAKLQVDYNLYKLTSNANANR